VTASRAAMGNGMPNLHRVAVALVALLAVPALGQEQPFEATGEIRFVAYGAMGSGASWSAERVVGPAVNMTRREDGGWAGDLLGHDLSLNLDKDRLSGPNVNLLFSQKGGKIAVEGLFYSQRVRISMDAKKLQGRMGECSYDLARTKAGTLFRGDVGCMRQGQRVPAAGKAGVELFGEAASANPPLPQLAIALVAVLPS
jgi:hypothetical protein